MRDLAESYNPISIPNSPIEFVLVAEDFGNFRPIVKSDNCGLDLLGFAASRSYSSKYTNTERNPSSILNMLRREKDTYFLQYINIKTHVASAYGSSSERYSIVSFFWKGATAPGYLLDEVQRVAELNFGILLDILPYRSKFDRSFEHTVDQRIPDHDFENFAAWHVAPVVQLIDYINNRRRRFRDLTRVLIGTYALLFVVTSVVLLTYSALDYAKIFTSP